MSNVESKLVYFQKHLHSLKLDKDLLDAEEQKRKSTISYVEILENELEGLHQFLAKAKIMNPILSQLKLNPIPELKKLKLQNLHKSASLVREILKS